MCGNMGSYSDSCSSVVNENLPSIISTLKGKMQPGPVCSLAGVCNERFHHHETALV